MFNDVDERLHGDLAVRLKHSLLHPGRHFGPGIANVNLTTGDVVLPAVQGGRLGEAEGPGARPFQAWLLGPGNSGVGAPPGALVVF